MAHPPAYSVADMAEVLKIDKNLLGVRLCRCPVKPTPYNFRKVVSFLDNHRKVSLYDKNEFLDWHHEHFGHLEKVN